jgi:hypothetical protein
MADREGCGGCRCIRSNDRAGTETVDGNLGRH